MTCGLCRQPISGGDVINYHHPIYRSEGGTEVEPTHKSCHVDLHKSKGDFAAWGSIGGKLTAATKRWAFNLKNVSTHPAHTLNRSFYQSTYSH